jgi:hypothetical protein
MTTRKLLKEDKTGRTASVRAGRKSAGSSQGGPAVNPKKSSPAASDKSSRTIKSGPAAARKRGGKKISAAAALKKKAEPSQGPEIIWAEGAQAKKVPVDAKTTSRPGGRKPPPKTVVPRRDREEAREIFPALPREYGENDFLVMVVDPDVMYASWEIREDALRKEKGQLTIRVFVAGGVTTLGPQAGRPVLDIKIGHRVGSGFFDLHMPGRDIITEIGLVSAGGTFRTILRSPVVSFPKLPTFDELGIVRKLFESGMRAGY